MSKISYINSTNSITDNVTENNAVDEITTPKIISNDVIQHIPVKKDLSENIGIHNRMAPIDVTALMNRLEEARKSPNFSMKPESVKTDINPVSYNNIKTSNDKLDAMDKLIDGSFFAAEKYMTIASYIVGAILIAFISILYFTSTNNGTQMHSNLLGNMKITSDKILVTPEKSNMEKTYSITYADEEKILSILGGK